MLVAKVLMLYVHLTHFTQNYIFKKKESKSKFVLNKHKYLLFYYYY